MRKKWKRCIVKIIYNKVLYALSAIEVSRRRLGEETSDSYRYVGVRECSQGMRRVMDKRNIYIYIYIYDNKS